MYNRSKILALAVIILIPSLFLVAQIPQTEIGNPKLVLNNFLTSETTYTNKTMHFQVADPYEGYSYFTYESGGTVQGPSDNKYYMSTAVSGYAEFFGFDEFVDHSIVSASVEWRTTLMVGTYHFVPLGYFYQKTALATNTHWALAIYWDSTGADLFYNTGNGDTPSSVSLFATAPTLGNPYQFTLQNFGDSTFVEVFDVPGNTTLYNGTIKTPTFDATVLYAGFGQYSSGNGNIYGVWDDLAIFDTIVNTPNNGYGFSTIDAYIDESFAHTFYDIVTGYNSSLEIDSSVTNITLVIQCWLNGTLFGAETVAEGKNILRHNITVTNTNHTIVFSQSNLTYSWGIEYGDDLFLYEYWIELDFTLTMGEIYKIVLEMALFYPEGLV